LITKRNFKRNLIDRKRRKKKKEEKEEEEKKKEDKMNRENKIKTFHDLHSIRLAYTKKMLCNLLETVLIGYARTFISVP
jgi:hypothetical protein